MEWKALDNNNVRWGDIDLGWQREGVIVCISWLFGCYFILSLFLVFEEMRVLRGKEHAGPWCVWHLKTVSCRASKLTPQVGEVGPTLSSVFLRCAVPVMFSDVQPSLSL